LVRTDTLHESILVGIRKGHLSGLLNALTALPDRAAFKERLTLDSTPDISLLPVYQEVLDLIHAARQEGRRVVLATGAPRRIADGMAARIGGGTEVMATESGLNLTGQNKAEALVRRFGSGKFDYIGNSAADVPVWRESRRAYVVGPPEQVKSWSIAAGRSLEVIFDVPSPMRSGIRAMRVHHWPKNILVLVPVLAAHRIRDAEAVVPALLLAVAFCMFSSLIYIWNDLMDLEADRQHPAKRSRPLACGELPIGSALVLEASLATAGVGFAMAAGPWGILGVGLYGCMNIAYSAWLKQIVLIDVFLLSSMFMWRVISGGLVSDIPLTPWLLGFCGYLFLSLAFAKRFSELHGLRERSGSGPLRRGYGLADDLPVALFGIGAGFASSLVLVLYVTSEGFALLYRRPLALLGLCPLLLYWISRVWMKAFRGELTEDPLMFAARDRATIFFVGLGVLLIALAGLK
jgi:4-hydroxybenzoate polyprenyltransferase